MTDDSVNSEILNNYRVVVFAEPDDPHELADLLAKELGLHLTDARIHMHAVPGILPDRLPESRAIALAEAIELLGVRAAAIASTDIPDLAHAKVLHHVRCLDSGLEIVGLHGESRCVVPWGDIRLISVGHVPQETRQRSPEESASGFQAGPHLPSDSPTVPPMSGPEVWIIRRNPRTGFRIEHNQMNYEYLGERKEGSATHNFRLFIDELISRTQQAYLTPAARAYKQHGLLKDYEFSSLEEHRQYVVRHVLLSQQMAQPE